MRWEGYSYTAQTVSELSAIDAPSRPLVAPLFFTYGVLVIAFGFGVWRSAAGQRTLRVLAGLLVGYGIACLTGPLTPMHQRGFGMTLTDTLHITSAIVDVMFLVLIIGFGAAAFGTPFRLYSIATIVIVLVCGALAGSEGGRIAASEPTPWVGVIERISIFGALLWMAVLATILLRARAPRSVSRREP